MKLKQKDRELFRFFFNQKKEWMKNNSLNISENLNTLKKEFINYMVESEQNENNSFMIFILMLDQQILESKKKVLEKKYNVTDREKLHWRPICPPLTDNKEILSWINESSIACEISNEELEKLNYSIKQKLKQNETERRLGWENSKNSIVRN